MGDEDISFELGDTVLLSGGQVDGLHGRIYYIDENLIRILPDGVSDRLVDIPIIEGDLDPALNIQHLYSISKRVVPAFVAQINAQLGEKAETFNKDGVPGALYTIKAIDEINDKIHIIDETGADQTISFEFRGIPLDQGFAVLRPRQIPIVEDTITVDAQTAAEEEVAADDIFEDVLNAELAASDEAEIREISASQRTYPDNIQRNDMLQDMISALDINAQKNPERQKEIRTLVEQLISLRNSILTYSRSGEPSGQIPTSNITLSELLESNNVPLSRPVIKAKRVLYLDHTEEAIEQIRLGNPSTDPTEIPDADVDIRYLQDVVNETVQYMDTQLGGIQSQVIAADSLPEWYLSWETLNNVYHATWSVAGDQATKLFKQDTEFLRFPVVDIDTPLTDGLPELDAENDIVVTSDPVTKIGISLLRGLGPRSTRIREKEAQRVIESAEEGSSITTLVFPLSEQRSLGSIRSGRLANDIAFSDFTHQTISDILERLDGIPTVPTTGGIISVGEDGNTNGSIPIEDWLANQPLYPLGLADATIELSNYGFTNQEFNIQQQEVIVNKIDSYRALIKQYIIELRDSMVKAISQQAVVENPFLQGEAYANLFQTLESEPLLSALVKEIQHVIPIYRTNDIAIVAGIMQTSADLFLTTMAQAPAPLGLERNRRVRDQYMQALVNALKKSEINGLTVYLPEPNTCPHVKDLALVKKQKDNTLQMKLFAKYLTKYEGVRKDNWINCSVCKEHLVCYHEVLLLKEFLHPREKEILHKELLLTFGGGQFHGKYICRNCGQPIMELEFDTNMEFSDDGAPMSALMDKEETALTDILDDILGPEAGEEEELKFETADQKIIYTAARKLFDTVGIYAKDIAYERIIQRVESDLIKQPSREDYKRISKGKRVVDYDIFINRILVASLAANCLLEIQTDIPGYVLRYKLPGCRAGFSGFPLGNEKDRTGVEYIICAVSTIRENAPPWNLTGFQAETNEKKRQTAIEALVNRNFETLLANASVQQQISVKRAYLQKVYGAVTYAEQLPENIPQGFRPYPYVVSGEEAAKTPVVSDAASSREKIRGWVSAAHQLGKDNGNYVKGSPLSDATCCLTRIQEPGKFWKERGAELPTLPFKNPPRGPVDSHLTVHFKVRPMSTFEVSIPPDILYKIFLKVCYHGPRKGLPHEPGYTNICAHCKFIFPENPYEPRPLPPISKESMKTYREEVEASILKGKVALETQGITVNSKTFESVLDTTHRAFHVDPPVIKKPIAGMTLLEGLRAMKPEPFEGWLGLITETMESLSKLPPNPSNLDAASAYGSMSNFAADLIAIFKREIGEENGAALEKILEDASAVETIQTYILIPFQRIVTGFHTRSLVLSDNFKLEGGNIQDDINNNIKNHLEFMSILEKRATGFTLEKIKWTRSRLTQVIVFLQKYIRGAYVPGGNVGLPYIVTALLGGILAEFIDPGFIPANSYTEGMIDPGSKAPIQILDICVQKIRKEGLRFTNEQIKEIINRRDEIEKLSFIRRFENLTPQEKAVAKMNKKLGLKEWAVGGTKAIYAYNPEQYDIESKQRTEMGFTELIDTGVAMGDEGGYDNAQLGEDDY